MDADENYSTDNKIDYLNRCLTLMQPWRDVMKSPANNHENISPDDLPDIDANYFAFFARFFIENKGSNAPISISQAASYISMSPSRASRFVSDLIKNKYLIEKISSKDRRQKTVSMNNETYLAVENAIEESMKSMEGVFRGAKM